MDNIENSNVNGAIPNTEQNRNQEPISICDGRWAIEEITPNKYAYPMWTQINLLKEQECIVTYLEDHDDPFTIKGKWNYDQVNNLLRISFPWLVESFYSSFEKHFRKKEKKNKITSRDRTLLAKLKDKHEEFDSDLIFQVKSSGKDYYILEDTQGGQFCFKKATSTSDMKDNSLNKETVHDKQSMLSTSLEENGSLKDYLNNTNNLIKGNSADNAPKRELDLENVGNVSNSTTQQVLSAISRLESAITQQSEKNDKTSRVIEYLEAEVRRLKTREDERRLEPMLRAVIALYDDVHRLVSEIKLENQQENVDSMKIIQRLGVLEKQVIELLRRQHAIDFTPTVGEKFDAKRHDVLERIKTDNQEDDLKIQNVYRIGFEFSDRTLRPAGVAVFSYEQQRKEQKLLKEEQQ